MPAGLFNEVFRGKESFPRAANASYKVWADFGQELGIKQSSAQVTINYQPAQLIGR